MAVKFAVYETARALYCRMHEDRQVGAAACVGALGVVATSAVQHKNAGPGGGARFPCGACLSASPPLGSISTPRPSLARHLAPTLNLTPTPAHPHPFPCPHPCPHPCPDTVHAAHHPGGPGHGGVRGRVRGRNHHAPGRGQDAHDVHRVAAPHVCQGGAGSPATGRVVAMGLLVMEARGLHVAAQCVEVGRAGQYTPSRG